MSKKVCIIVGHGKSRSGGYDSGAVSKDGKTHEFSIAKEIAKYAAEYLGCALMNYDGDLYLTERIRKVNAADYDFIAEIHLNAGGGKGVEVFYYNGSPTGLKVSKEICAEISEQLGVENRGAKVRMGENGRDYFAIIRDTRPTAVLVETVFIDNNQDLAKVKNADGQRRCGEAIGRAIEKSLGVEKTEITVEIIATSLNIRSGAGKGNKSVGYVKNGETHRISETDEAAAWGRLSDGRGWISLNSAYVRRI